MNQSKKYILVTGGSGFIGSNFIPYFLKKNREYHLINLDKLTYASSNVILKPSEEQRYTFIKGTIVNIELVNHIFDKYDIRGVINFAAESHVDNSITNPGIFIESNIIGTYTLLDISMKHWMISPHTPGAGYELCRFHHISTDEVYGALGGTGSFKETDRFAPNSPYSASKASSDMIVRSYSKTFGLNTVTTNCSNNYGPHQHSEKFIPTVIRNALGGRDIPIYGGGGNIRDWLHVLDHCEAIDLAFHKGASGETYNIGSDNEWSNLELANKICSILDDCAKDVLEDIRMNSFSDLIKFVADRPGHDWRYAIDSEKFRTQVGWHSKIKFDDGLRQTIDWYINKYTLGKGVEV